MCNMQIRMALTLLPAMCGLAAAAEPATVFYVSPAGNDAWSGRLAEPNAARSDGPLATLARARDVVRAARRGGASGPVTVYLRGGVYRIDKAIEFTPDDSGTAQAPITYAAFPGQRPVISGGRAITGWRRGEGALWQATVPGVKEGRWRFHQLFVNGQRRTRARTPNVGYLYTEGVLAPIDHAKWYEPGTEAKQGFRFRPGDLRRFTNFDDAMLVIYHSWTTSIHFITALDPKERTVRVAPHSTWPIGYWWEYNTRYHVENVPEALDSPGEWYLDRNSGVLSYWPMPGEALAAIEAIAPVAQQTLVAFRGQPAAKRYVEHLQFRGLSFQHADCRLSPDMPTDQQGAFERPATLAAEGLRHALFEDCEIAHVGENGLWLDAGSSDNTLRRCHIHDLGGGALFIGPRDYQPREELLVQRNTVDNCYLHDGSNIFRGSQGVWIGKSSHNRLTHNEICGFHHIGVSVGHSWGYAPTTAHHNLVAYNRIHHICNGLFSDGGGIYTLGISPGTEIRNNVVHDVTPTPLMPVGGCGIYHDEGSTGIVDEDNVVYRVGAAAFHQHYGRDNTARNNIFAFGGRDPVTCARPEEHRSYTFEGNIVLTSAGQAVSDHYSPMKCKTEFRRNLYWDTSGKPPLFSGVNFAKWQETGRDRESKIADPRFVNAEAADFRLRPDSPALAMGFRPIDASQAGLYGDAAWTGLPAKFPREPLPKLPPPPPAPPPRPLVEPFESTPVGKLPGVLHCMPADRPEALSVSEESAAGGRRALRFTKTPGLKFGFEPHAYFSSDRYGTGRLRFACDLMNHAARPAECYLSLRDYSVKGREYVDGPLLILKPDGTLTASGRPVAKVPPGKWVHIEIQLDHGKPAAAPDAPVPPLKTYRLTVTVAGAKPQASDAIPCAGPEFTKFTWFGFSSTGPLGSTFYVDNLRLELCGE